MNRNKTTESPKTAVALQWDGLTTPLVTASGQGLTGEQIIQLAVDNGVRLHEDAGLARALSCIPVGEEIPRELYIAVAEVLAFVYFLDEILHSYEP